jgi:hypothetical protein
VPVPEAKAGKNRVHLDLATESAAHQAAVLADPEGGEFCVLSPR